MMQPKYHDFYQFYLIFIETKTIPADENDFYSPDAEAISRIFIMALSFSEYVGNY